MADQGCCSGGACDVPKVTETTTEAKKDACCGGGACRDPPVSGMLPVADAADAAAQDAVRNKVRELYDKVATTNSVPGAGGCCPPGEGGACTEEAKAQFSCCGVDQDVAVSQIISTRMGYTEEEIDAVPEGANMGLGCGNPGAIASLAPGETVLDLGAGGGLDCFLSARQVGEQGQVIGVDMTPSMVSKARENAKRGKYANVDFRLGEIENLPVGDELVDVIISNCVINLSTNKQRVYDECFRVLVPGGRIAFSDVVATVPLPEEMRRDAFLYGACIGGASLIDDLKEQLSCAGFEQIVVEPKDESREFMREWAPDKPITDYVVSANITAVKPVDGGACGGGGCC